MTAGFRPGRLNGIEAFLRRAYVEAGRLPGTLLMVARGGETAMVSCLGHADLERDRPITPETVFRIYSMTKPLTSLAFMMLVEEGLVSLDDPVERFIPAWRGMGVFEAGTLKTGFRTRPAARPMTMLDLMRHTAGLTYGFQLRTNVDAAYRQRGIGEVEKAGTLDGMIEALAHVPLEFSPGDAWNYSVATDVLGWLVGRLAGEPFEDVLAGRILGPLAMEHTGFHVPERLHARLACCYEPDGRGGLRLQDDAATSTFRDPPSFVSGGGGLVSTGPDYLTWCEAMRAGRADLVGRKTWAQMTANQLPAGQCLPALSRSLFSEAAYDGVGFGLGLATTVNWARTGLAGSNGDWFWGGAASTFFFVDPAEELSVVFMTQLLPSSTWPVRRELRQMIYGALA